MSNMTLCPKHKRYIEIRWADGTVTNRPCPECPPNPKRFLRLATGEVFTPAIYLDENGHWKSND